MISKQYAIELIEGMGYKLKDKRDDLLPSSLFEFRKVISYIKGDDLFIDTYSIVLWWDFEKRRVRISSTNIPQKDLLTILNYVSALFVDMEHEYNCTNCGVSVNLLDANILRKDERVKYKDFCMNCVSKKNI